jgi:hypothetical protein
MIDADQTFSFSGIKRVQIENNLVKVYPNPAATYFQIEQTLIEKISEISILNQNGKTIEKLNNPAAMAGQIDLKRLSPGLYFVQLKYRNGASAVQKIIVSK